VRHPGTLRKGRDAALYTAGYRERFAGLFGVKMARVESASPPLVERI
jgi:hypothetical protein